MNNLVICIDKNNQVICWGDIKICEKYIKQFYSISLDDVIYEDYNKVNNFTYYYEDYEVYQIQGTNVYLTLGEIRMIKEGCQEETRGIKYIQSELEHLITMTNVYNKAVIDELIYFKNFMQDVFNIHAKYNMNNSFSNLDIDALHSSYLIERENQGLPIIFID